MSIVNKRFAATSQELNGLPDYIQESDLCVGKVECSSKYVSAPGFTGYCPAVVPEFLHAVYDLSKKRATVGWNGNTVVAEDTIMGNAYAAAFNGSTVQAMKNGEAVKSKEDLPERMVFLLSFPFYLEDEEFRDAWDLFYKDLDEQTNIMAFGTLFAGAYGRNDQNPVTKVYEAKPVSRLNETKAADPKYIATDKIGGSFAVFRSADMGGAVYAPVELGDVKYGSQYNGKYRLFPKEEMTSEQVANIIEMDDTMIVSPAALETVEMIYQTKDLISPVRNILETGLPGTGKTEMAKQIAAMLGLPFYFTQLFDLFSGEDAKGTFQPVAVSEDGVGDLPTAEEIVFDTADAYFALTGQPNPGATVEEVEKLRDERIRERSRKDSGTTIQFVPGVIEHASEPCVIFIDEITSPKNPAAITVFNSLLDRSSRITLTDNRVIHRHKNCIIIAAGNFSDDGVEMDGFRDPNRSFLDRFDEVIHLEALSGELVKAMLIANNNNWSEEHNDNVPIDTFVSILPELREICMKHGDMCEFRAINAWFRKSLITGKPIASAKSTVIGISTRQEACAAEMLKKIVSRFRPDAA